MYILKRFTQNTLRCQGGRKIKKLTLNIPLSMVKLLTTLWMVYQYTQTLKVQASFLTQWPERKETMRVMVTLKQLQSLMAVIGEN